MKENGLGLIVVVGGRSVIVVVENNLEMGVGLWS